MRVLFRVSKFNDFYLSSTSNFISPDFFEYVNERLIDELISAINSSVPAPMHFLEEDNLIF